VARVAPGRPISHHVPPEGRSGHASFDGLMEGDT
jgi:hypothetical protein